MKTALEFANYLDANLKKPWSSKADIDLMAKEIEQRDQEKINEGKRLAAAESTRLLSALENYGRHHGWCFVTKVQTGIYKGIIINESKACDCGFMQEKKQSITETETKDK